MNPETLYELCLGRVVSNITLTTNAHTVLPDHVLFDVFYQQLLDRRLCYMSSAIDFKVFIRLLKVKHRRKDLHRIFQALYDHGSNIDKDIIAEIRSANIPASISNIDLGLNLAIFSAEGGWYTLAHSILSHVETMCLQLNEDQQSLLKLLECFRRRIYVESSYCMFEEAQLTFAEAMHTVERLTELGATPNLAALYANFAHLHIMRSEYDEAYKWSKSAVILLNDSLPKKIVVDVLRQASKACVFKRRFEQAGMFIGQAVILAEELMLQGEILSYCDTMADYGFYHLNYDNVKASVGIYKKVVKMRRDLLGRRNFLVGLSYEELAYAVYVCEYVTGKFHEAREHADRALRILERYVPNYHLAIASTKRVMALILEEIAVDMREDWDVKKQEDYLKTSEQLHKSALEVSLRAFGTNNVRTAKHYGNLGRLYQSMKMYDRAEQMHLKAIEIKERLLGEDDYEVGMSLGHLASLYSFHMKRYADARRLYMRSIKISLSLFGDTYSGLEYDYRGLIKVFTELEDSANRLHYVTIMREWQERRQALVRPNESPVRMDVEVIVDKFLSL